jgi:hypothetical protein
MTRQRIKLRHDNAAAWAAVNPVLLSGEAGFESDTRLLKIGNGVTSWNDLSYVVGGIDSLADLADVNTTSRVDGSVLIYDGQTAKFVADSLNTRLTLADGGNF